MTKDQIDNLISGGKIANHCGRPDLIETHISWIILCDRYAYKIKKPVFYSFLDFSTLEKRRYFCERELVLNKRLTENIYIDVQPVRKDNGEYSLGFESGEIVDFAVRMLKMDRSRQMDLLLLNNRVTTGDIEKLAHKIASFHRGANIIHGKNQSDIQIKFEDLEKEERFLSLALTEDAGRIIRRAMQVSLSFMERNKDLLENRQINGFIRDCHGDLHCRNIFLLPGPQPFDCIEFSDDYRQIDVLNEIAFLCMDLDFFARPDLSVFFVDDYNRLFPVLRIPEDRLLFIYYKSYRANIRAKINSLRARDEKNGSKREIFLKETGKYLTLMDQYIDLLEL